MIRVENLSVRLPDFALNGVSFDVAPGEFFTILGPTGAGKTLILESIAGMVPISGGRIRIGGRDVTDLPPERRGIGIVYQDQALFPHLSVIQNIRYGLRYRPKTAGREAEIDRLVQRLGLQPLLARAVVNLSGGERQRVALARALAVAPEILLLDEPLSALDPNFREEIRDLLKSLHRETGITALMVTHDFAEAHFLATRTAVISGGRIEQVGPVTDVFRRPVSPAVAAFVGMKNIFEARFDGGTAKTGPLELTLSGVVDSLRRFVAVRPEDLEVGLGPPDAGRNGLNCFSGKVTRIDHQGVFCEIRVRCDGLIWQAIVPTGRLVDRGIVEGDEIWIEVPPEKIHVM
ncbi:MAG: ABC transporter ATP-binding protein [Desulfobacteraceae bacterium]|jgi:molybdate/tungstate transport system ATP-binding protein|nr:ABC transporter ATP-binding protein [Desulfobacteraceae bacterium]